MKRLFASGLMALLVLTMVACGNKTTSSENSETWDRIPSIMVDGELYIDTGYDSDVDRRCGNIDGTIDSECSGSELPTKNNQSNFGTGFDYQYGPVEGTIEIFMNGDWRVFATEEVKKTYRPGVAAAEESEEKAIQICIDGVDYFGPGPAVPVEPDESAIEYIEIPAGGDATITAFARLEEGKLIVCCIDGEWGLSQSLCKPLN